MAFHQDVCRVRVGVQHAAPMHVGQSAEHDDGHVANVLILQCRPARSCPCRQARVVQREREQCQGAVGPAHAEDRGDAAVERERRVSSELPSNISGA